MSKLQCRSAIAAALFLAGCASALVIPQPGDERWAANFRPETTYPELVRGRELYVTHCAGCHTLYRPEKYRSDKWPRLLDDMEKEIAEKRMKKKPRYTEDEREAILTFLMTASASERARRENAKSRH